MKRGKIAFFDIYNPIPLNSGGDWYRYQLLNDLGNHYQVQEYYTIKDKDSNGYWPEKINFCTKYVDSSINWNKISPALEALRPELFLIKPKIDDYNPDIIFFNIYTYHIAKKFTRNKKIPMALVMHNIEGQYLKNHGKILSKPIEYYERHILKMADIVITISPLDRMYAANYTNFKHIFTIPPKINKNIFKQMGETHEFGANCFNVLFYGALDRKQNKEALHFIKFELIPEMNRLGYLDQIRINVFGSGKPPSYLQLDKDLTINYIGPVDDAGKYIRGSDVILVPIKNPGGVKIRILEALSCGKPIIASTEAVTGLPNEIKRCVVIADTTNEVIESIVGFKNKTIKIVPDIDVLDKYFTNNDFENLLEYMKMIC